MQTKSTVETHPKPELPDDGLNCIRGIMWATPVGLAVWTLTLWLIFR